VRQTADRRHRPRHRTRALKETQSPGASGKDDFAQFTRTAVVNKRAGGMGLITGRKSFQRPMADGIKLLNAVQDVYLCKDVKVA